MTTPTHRLRERPWETSPWGGQEVGQEPVGGDHGLGNHGITEAALKASGSSAQVPGAWTSGGVPPQDPQRAESVQRDTGASPGCPVGVGQFPAPGG